MVDIKNIFLPDLNTRLLQEDLEKLSDSFKLLNDTISDVSSEASSAANYLKEELEHTSKIFLSTIDLIDDFVLVENGDGTWKILNQFGLNLYDLKYDDVIGKTCQELAEEFPQYAETFLYCYEIDELTWNSGKPHREIMSFIFHDKMHHFDVIKTPIFNADGSRKEIITIGRDITELKNEELRNKACTNALNVASDNICIFDDSGIIIFCNDHMINEFEFIEHSNIEGKHINIISEVHFSTEKIGEIWETISNNIPWRGFTKLHTLNKKEIEGQTTILPVMNGCTHPAYFICMIKTKNYCPLIKHSKFPTCCNKPLECLLTSDYTLCTQNTHAKKQQKIK